MGCRQETLSVNKVHSKSHTKLLPRHRDSVLGFPLQLRQAIEYVLCTVCHDLVNTFIQ